MVAAGVAGWWWAVKALAWIARPQLVVSALLLFGALLFALLPSGLQRPPPPVVAADGGGALPLIEREVRLLLIDAAGLERPQFVTLSFVDSPAARLSAVIEALRGQLVDLGVWPRAGAAPVLFRGEVGVRSFVVLDFGDGFAGLSVAQERQLLGSLVATLRAEGIDEIRVLRHGAPREAPFGHLLQPTAL